MEGINKNPIQIYFKCRMMKKTLLVKVLLLSILGFIIIVSGGLLNPVFAQKENTGTITGKVVDAETGDPLVGANVYIKGTIHGDATDVDGDYKIIYVPEGTYVLNIAYIGYKLTEVTDVIVKSDEVLKLDVTMKPDIMEGEVVVVEARALRNTEASLLKERQLSSSVSDAISGEKISESGSGDAADAMKKVTGATVMGGKFVYVRGLGEWYSMVQLDGADLPSLDPNKKSVHLDLFSSDLLENIVTVKSFTPDK